MKLIDSKPENYVVPQDLIKTINNLFLLIPKSSRCKINVMRLDEGCGLSKSMDFWNILLKDNFI